MTNPGRFVESCLNMVYQAIRPATSQRWKGGSFLGLVAVQGFCAGGINGQMYYSPARSVPFFNLYFPQDLLFTMKELDQHARNYPYTEKRKFDFI